MVVGSACYRLMQISDLGLEDEKSDRIRTIGSSNDDLERSTPLTPVLGLLNSNWSTPESALVVGGAGRVRAVHGVGVKTWVSLDIHVESLATCGSVAL